MERFYIGAILVLLATSAEAACNRTYIEAAIDQRVPGWAIKFSDGWTRQQHLHPLWQFRGWWVSGMCDGGSGGHGGPSTKRRPQNLWKL